MKVGSLPDLKLKRYSVARATTTQFSLKISLQTKGAVQSITLCFWLFSLSVSKQSVSTHSARLTYKSAHLYLKLVIFNQQTFLTADLNLMKINQSLIMNKKSQKFFENQEMDMNANEPFK